MDQDIPFKFIKNSSLEDLIIDYIACDFSNNTTKYFNKVMGQIKKKDLKGKLHIYLTYN